MKLKSELLIKQYTTFINSKRVNMLIVYLEKLNEFAKNHANARKSLGTWKSTTEEAIWKNKQDVSERFSKSKNDR